MKGPKGFARMLVVAGALVAAIPGVYAQSTTEGNTKIDLYGFVMVDMGYDVDQVNPDWYDVLRPTKLPAFTDEFGHNGNFWASVRQSRLGVKTWTPTKVGELYTIFEFELFGTDEVAPSDQEKYLKVYDLYAPLFAKLTPEASEKLRKGNYERVFNEARRKVRAWEKANVK